MLEVGTFGGLSLRQNGSQPEMGRVVGELLAYLLVHHDSRHRREKIAEIIWPDKSGDLSRSSLNTTLWRLTTILGDAHVGDGVTIEKHGDYAIALSLSKKTVIDFISLRETLHECEIFAREHSRMDQCHRRRLRSALSSYLGVFLEGSDSDWILRERERLHCLYLRGLTLLMHDLVSILRFEEALECGREILSWDDLRETTHREVMWLYVMNGQRCEAIAQFKRLKQRLQSEIGVEPMPETQLLYRHILGGEGLADDLGSASNTGLHPASVNSAIRRAGEQRISIYRAISRGVPGDI